MFHSSPIVDPKFYPQNMEDMVSTWVNIEYDREIVDSIVDEELENLDDVLEMDIDVFDDYCS